MLFTIKKKKKESNIEPKIEKGNKGNIPFKNEFNYLGVYFQTTVIAYTVNILNKSLKGVQGPRTFCVMSKAQAKMSQNKKPAVPCPCFVFFQGHKDE